MVTKFHRKQKQKAKAGVEKEQLVIVFRTMKRGQSPFFPTLNTM